MRLGVRRSAAERTRATAWTAAVGVSTAVVWFLHECAHGLGYRANGIHVSTGFNMVGGPGRSPGDADFRSALPVTGTPNLGTVLGPLSTWAVAGAATIAFSRRPTAKTGQLWAALAVSAAFQRLLPLVPFFAAAPFGHVIYQDEVEWAARHVHGLQFPMSFDDFQVALRDYPSEFLRTPAVYAWPGASVAVSAVCLACTYDGLRRDSQHFPPTWGALAGVPLTSWIAVGALFAVLDRHIRIEW